MRQTAWRIDFTEYERGWGSRPSGYNLYAEKALATAAYDEHWAGYSNGEAPDYYIHASSPKLVELTVREALVLGELNSCSFG